MSDVFDEEFAARAHDILDRFRVYSNVIGAGMELLACVEEIDDIYLDAETIEARDRFRAILDANVEVVE